MYRNPINPREVPAFSTLQEATSFLKAQRAIFFSNVADKTYTRQLLEGEKLAFPAERFMPFPA